MNPKTVSALPLALIVLSLTACGPESNSRYGDQYWDPWTTKETFDPIVAPEFSVEFVDTTDDGVEEYEARVTLDATKTYERLYAHSWGFVRGTKERETLASLGASDDFSLVYREDPDDPNNDERLVATTPGHYRMVFVGETEGPLGKVTVRFDDLGFTLPGCPSTFDYYGDYIDDTLETCSSCHDAGDAQTALDLDDNSLTNRRQEFLQYVDAHIDANDLVLPGWVVNPQHLGSATIASDSAAYRHLAEFIDILEGVKSGNGGAALSTANNSGGDTVPSGFCVAKPSGFAYTQE